LACGGLRSKKKFDEIVEFLPRWEKFIGYAGQVLLHPACICGWRFGGGATWSRNPAGGMKWLGGGAIAAFQKKMHGQDERDVRTTRPYGFVRPATIWLPSKQLCQRAMLNRPGAIALDGPAIEVTAAYLKELSDGRLSFESLEAHDPASCPPIPPSD